MNSGMLAVAGVWFRPTAVGVLTAGALLLAIPRVALASCASPTNAIEAENCLPGTPQSTWDVSGAGDSSIQGFATDISVNRGSTVQFKVKTTASAYRLDIYRMGYYQGNGARLVAAVQPSATLPQTQPACRTDSTGLYDCGNWAVSASWVVPANATSGIYFARAVRTDNGGASHILFIVRDDASHSDILFQTADTTWQAYNQFGGASLYFRNGTYQQRAFKVSYNRPFDTRAVSEGEDFVWNGEYPMVRWLEANGYDVTYFTGVDADRFGSLIRNHRIFLSNGHDEYWSGPQRANVEAARDAGVHLAFFSGNKVFWKTRWEASIDGTGTPYRTLVCYKETHANAVIDPADPPTWTGTWRDARFSPPADGGRPENALAGSIFMVNGLYDDAIRVTQADGQLRFWRNTSIASLGPGQIATLAPGTLGAEVDVDLDNGYRPAGLLGLSTNFISTSSLWLLDNGSSYGSGAGTHRLTLYRAASGALVFATGSYQWSWGLDATHDRDFRGSTTDVRVQQATVNLFADMGTQPATLQPGLVPGAASTDATPPASAITSPTAGATLAIGVPVTITGTAADVGGIVAAVEVSTDGGATWHPATGTQTWSYVWTPSGNGATTIKSRAVDDSARLETPSAGVSVAVGSGVACTTNCSLWSLAAVPGLVDGGPDSPVELGVRFTSDAAGQIAGIRFYKASTNTGTHVAHLWSGTGTLLATATFTGESASGWQQVNFAVPVSIAANTVYVASYFCPSGHYSADLGYFAAAGVDSSPLHAPANASGGNGVYAYGASSSFPTQTYLASNYWVDVVFSSSQLSSIAVTPATSTVSAGATQAFTATATYSDGSVANVTGSATWTSSSAAVATVNAGVATGQNPGTATITAAVGTFAGSAQLTVQAAPLAITTTSLPAATTNLSYTAALSATGGTAPYTWSIASGLPPGLSLNAATGVISGTPTTSGTYAFTAQVTDAAASTASKSLSIVASVAQDSTIWPGSAVPGLVDGGPDSSVELGVKFRADSNGFVKGIRFYKASTNTGTHVANLWTSGGNRLATATFTGETATGWQQVLFSSPVAVTANTVYVASYHANNGHYSADVNYFATNGVDRPPLHALANGVSGGDGVYAYGATSSFPNQTWLSTNYWVDVVFSATPPATLSSVAVTPANPTIQVGATQQFAATGTYSDGTTQNLTSTATWASTSTAVAPVSAAGLATGASAGAATISATVGSVTGSASLTVVPAPLAIATASLPGGTQFVAYSATLTASGGLPPYTWSIPAGLPPGLTLSPATGVISGTPTTSGAYGFTVQVTDAAAQSTSKALSITVTAAPPLVISTTALPGGTQGSPYSATLAATGGLPPYTWSIPAGLPPGLSLAPATGVISGTPTAVGAYSFTTNVTDSALSTANTTLSITVVPPGNYTLWPSGTVPVLADGGPDSSVELGVKFRADQAGYITGIRFYKSTANTGTHTGSLWTSTGTRLASATFANETPFGWQQVNFATPVAIAANTVYVASYHANGGHYAADVGYFSGAGWDNLPLHALADGVSGGNGAYRYGAGSVFPNLTWQGANYWVDVVFNPSASVPSLTSIGVTPASVTLAAGATQQYAAVATYSDGSTVDVTREATWTSTDAGVAAVTSGAVATAIASGTATIRATMSGVSGGASLTVSPPPPPPDEGPGGPILVISSSANQVSRYLAEILRAEGFQEFTATDISFVTTSTLAGYDLVLLGNFALTPAQASMIDTWVSGGGNLVAMRPDKQLAGLLGIRDASATLSEGYLRVDTSAAPGTGIVGETIQFHGTADLYDLDGARAVATLYSSATASTGRPAVTLATYGAGQAAAFTYDLARSVVYTRQGNPAWSGQERDGSPPGRSDDLFYGAAVFDPQPDWVDLTKVAIPQADEQQRLLANLIIQMNSGKKPLPRFWYFPSGFKAVVVMTGDDHAGGGTAGRFNGYLSASPPGCSVADWQCIRGTSYIYRNTPLTNTQAQSYVSQGFEVALHVNTNCADYTSYEDLDSYYASQLASFASKYTSVPAPRTNRTHCITFSDFDTQPQVALAHGIRLDANYYYWPPGWVNDRPGFFTGSGIPMRFALRTGQTIDVYQVATQMTDESGQTYPMTVDTLLDNALGPLGHYGAFAVNAHTDTAASEESDAIVSSAKARGVPVVTARQMLTWLDGRNGSTFGSLSWNGSVLGFTVTAPTEARNLRGMLPTQVSGLTLASLTRSGTPVSFTTQVAKGIPYAFFPATSGTYQATYR